MNQDAVTSIRRFYRLIVIVAIGAMVIAYGGSYLFSPSYSSTTKILVRAREARFLTSTGQDLSNQPGVIDSSLAKSLSETNAGLIKSREVAERVVTELKLDKPKPDDGSILTAAYSALKQAFNVAKALVLHGFYAEPSSPFEGAVVSTQNQLDATPIKDSYLIEVRASANDPKLAAAMADAAANALLDVSRARFQQDAQTYRDFLKDRVDAAQADVTAADQAIQKYKQDQGITNVTESLRLSAGSEETARADLRQAGVDLDTAQARRSSIVAKLESTSSTSDTTTTIQTGRSATTTTSVGPNPVYQDLEKQLAGTDADIAALQAKQQSLSTALASTVTGVLPAQEAKLSELELSLTTKTQTYSTLSNSYQQAVLSAAQGAVEVSKVDTASVPLYPDKPVRWLFAILGLLVGIGAGTGLAIFAGGRTERVPTAPLPQSTRPAPIPQTAFTATARPEPTTAPDRYRN
jgi:uncharacterized protein involved in exopolysaccharide biosynthesis